eukprot:CAMPEP_0178947622 /NCGR_PEP_ID=MMETSP0789-20121207/4967_1 /TAXON_ID=3005 /ORGANISM="Rhizosolenia setigera, Strain CCMP 1694" /LENGTH=482 /DNA_ID=CAMNT_0020627793 /DNA_START=18 /DNA_END=1467 /DNA_ORIENTATION=+
MDAKVESLYREIYSDLSVDATENQKVIGFFNSINPPPDKIVWLRATAFRIGCEFLSEENKDANVALLRCINVIVHNIENTLLTPRDVGVDKDAFDEDSAKQLEEKDTEILTDGKVDQEESIELINFFKQVKIPSEKLTWARATAFKQAVDFLSSDEDSKASNISLLRGVNVIIHFLEQTCYLPKPYVLQAEPEPSISVKSIGLNSSIEKAIQHLWDLDMNRANPGQDYVINVQQGKKPYHRGDSASAPLFTSVKREILRRKTYSTFIALLDNYEAKTGVSERISNTERREVSQFLDAIMETAPMQFCHKYLHANAKDIPQSKSEFKKLLHSIWFSMYHRSRCNRADSSGFEHVFVGEIKNGEISGFHNWIQFYIEEKKGNVDYLGYIKPRSRSDAQTDHDDYLLTCQFEWNGVLKKVGTMFLGVSPEFEMALYTLCFLMGNEENCVDLKTGDEVFEMKIKCFSMARGKIGTSFPEVVHHYDS